MSLSCPFGVHWVLVCGGKGGGGQRSGCSVRCFGGDFGGGACEVYRVERVVGVEHEWCWFGMSGFLVYLFVGHCIRSSVVGT